MTLNVKFNKFMTLVSLGKGPNTIKMVLKKCIEIRIIFSNSIWQASYIDCIELDDLAYFHHCSCEVN